MPNREQSLLRVQHHFPFCGVGVLVDGGMYFADDNVLPLKALYLEGLCHFEG